MICERYSRCGACAKENNCPYDYMGDGEPFCGEFECTATDCKRESCMSDEDYMDAYGYLN